jgi:hypothetical protein
MTYLATRFWYVASRVTAFYLLTLIAQTIGDLP